MGVPGEVGVAGALVLKRAALVVLGLYVSGLAVRVSARKYYIFLPDYLRWSLTRPAPPPGTLHLFLLFADHFEPDYDAARVRAWGARYRALASRHHDRDGRPPQHTFFYPGDQPRADVFAALHDLVAAGLGEVELHYHHDFDTEPTFRAKLQTAIRTFQQYGFLQTLDGGTHFAFVHGNWGLDNSNGASLCGVNTELRLLHELGCFADFTFPSVYEDAQPPFVNAIYAARDDDRPKSYDRRLPLTDLDRGADLMLFEGPLLFYPSRHPRQLFLGLDDGDVHPAVPASPARVDRWVRAGVHVDRRPDWIFIKVHGHGISSPADADAVLGPGYDAALSWLETHYNDGRRYRLHYITAREAYNLARAAAAGATGEPEQYFDRPVPPYVADARRAPREAWGGEGVPR